MPELRISRYRWAAGAIALLLFPLLALVAIVMLRLARRTEVD